MKVIIASHNQTKINAVKENFQNAEIIPVDVESGVSAQPMTDEETLTGAMNRAKNAQKLYPKQITIGLEGGVMFIQDNLYLSNWGALQMPTGQVLTAAGSRIKLPSIFIPDLEAGKELSEIMNVYTRKEDIRNKEGAIGIFTNNYLSRTGLFIHIVNVLKGQMEYVK